MYKHILVPYDGSPLSDRAVAEAIALARHGGAKLSLLNVIVPYHIPLSGDHSSEPVKEIERRFQAEFEKRAAEMLAHNRQRAQSAGIECQAFVRSGVHPHEEIIQAAKDNDCDLILMASHGRRGIQALLLGSETVKVLTHCSIPVLVVR